MKHATQTRLWSPPQSAFAGFRFPAEVIVVAVRWYLRYGLCYRDVEELLAERGIEVDHVTVYRWVQRFTPLLADAARFGRHSPGDRWYVDETYVKVNGVWRYVYRAVDQHGVRVERPGREPLAQLLETLGGVGRLPELADDVDLGRKIDVQLRWLQLAQVT